MLIAVIDQYLKTRPKDDREKRCFHPSSIHKTPEELCRSYLDGDNAQEFPPQILRVFDNGHAVHDRLQRYLEKSGVLLAAEVPVRHRELEIVGRADGLILLNGKLGVLEIKSCNSSVFFSLRKPLAEHVQQVHAYMLCLSVPRACILYEHKDSQLLKEFFLREDPEIKAGIVEKIKAAQKLVKDALSQESAGEEEAPGNPGAEDVRDAVVETEGGAAT